VNRVLSFHEGVIILLVHFHHMCKGDIPLSSDFDWSCPSAQSMAGLSEADLRLVRTLIAAGQEMREFSIPIDLY
jgi:hypothetical protein